MKLRDILMAGTAVTLLYIAGDIAMPSPEIKTAKPKATATATAESEQEQKQTAQTDNSSFVQQTLDNAVAETLPVYEGYEAPELQKYDKIIIEVCKSLENQMEIEGFKSPPPELVKKIMLVETAWGGSPHKEFLTDPCQTKKDFAYKLAVRGGCEGFFKKNGFDFLQNQTIDEVTRTFYAAALYLSYLASDYDSKIKTLSDEKREYILQKGDIIDKIAKKFNKEGFNTTVDGIINLNKIKDPKKLQIGQKLYIPNEKRVSYIKRVDFSNQLSLALRYNGGGDKNYKTKFESIKVKE